MSGTGPTHTRGRSRTAGCARSRRSAARAEPRSVAAGALVDRYHGKDRTQLVEARIVLRKVPRREPQVLAQVRIQVRIDGLGRHAPQQAEDGERMDEFALVELMPRACECRVRQK